MSNINKIKDEIERLKGICMVQIKANSGQTFPFVMEMTGYDKLLAFIDSLPDENLPDNLDEAAKDYCNSQPEWENKILGWVEEKDKEECRRDFKAGAEWMAEQGVTFETIMQEDDVDELVPTCPDMYNHGYSCGDKVIVQIRNKQ